MSHQAWKSHQAWGQAVNVAPRVGSGHGAQQWDQLWMSSHQGWGPAVGTGKGVTPCVGRMGIESSLECGEQLGDHLWDQLWMSHQARGSAQHQPWVPALGTSSGAICVCVTSAMGTDREEQVWGLRAGTSVGHGTQREDTLWGRPWGLAMGCGMWIHSAGSPTPVGLWDRNIAPLGAGSVAMVSPV